MAKGLRELISGRTELIEELVGNVPSVRGGREYKMRGGQRKEISKKNKYRMSDAELRAQSDLRSYYGSRHP